MLSADDLADLAAIRRDLHRRPEISRHEAATAARIAALLAPTGPDEILTGLGGHGVAAIWRGPAPGPTVMARAELDALPIPETGPEAGGPPPWASETPGLGHLCGHDGHMAGLLGVARLISRHRPARGRVALLFQPAEEDGSGAAAVIADPRWARIAPDRAFSLHNMPGLPMGLAEIAPGPFACASCGIRIRMRGREAHASQPETGISPARAMARLIEGLAAMQAPPPAPGAAPGPEYATITLTHARLGAPAFGIAPGEAEVLATLRSVHAAPMAALKAQAEALAREAAAAEGLRLEISWHDDFAPSINDAGAVGILRRAMDAAGMPWREGAPPMRPSEDFGRFGMAGAQAAMFLLGAGEATPPLHDPAYDFPDALIGIGAEVLARALLLALEEEPG